MSKLTQTISDGVAVLTLSDPATLNAASLDMVGELHEACKRLARVDEVHCLLITGEGRGFCSGANLAGGGPAAHGHGELDAGAALESVYNPFLSLLRDYPKPLVAAVNGPAAGIGASIALACDIVVAAESAYFLQAFRRIGLVPDGGATYLLPRIVGKARAMELMLLGDKLSARTALEWGLINRCVPDEALMDSAQEIAQALAEGPKALGAIRRLVWDSLDAEWDDQLHAERMAQQWAGRTQDFREGVQAFLDKRPARFTRR